LLHVLIEVEKARDIADIVIAKIATAAISSTKVKPFFFIKSPF
jgi:hypothetical protein